AGARNDAGGNVLSGRSGTWSRGQAGVARVSEQGLVTGVAPGAATITAVSEGHAGIAVITVSTVRVASVEVSPTSRQLSVGQTVQLGATAKDSVGTALAGRVVTWSTSASLVAVVSGTGLVTAVGAGTAVITATSEGQGATDAITVVNVPVGSVT